MERVVLLTGGNLGNVRETLAEARNRLIDRIGPEWKHSSVWESEPWGFEAETHFFNQVLVLETSLQPPEVLAVCQQVEKELGRKREEVISSTKRFPQAGTSCTETNQNLKIYDSRTIDIDILFYGDQIVELPELIIPHPLIAERKFVLNPLREILPDWVHPVYRKTVAQLDEDFSG